MRKHSTKLASKTTTTVKGISEIRSPKRPSTKVSAKNAMTVVNVAENTGSAIRFAAFSAASTGPSRSFLSRASACSPTTIASSTTMPSVMISANSEIILIVSPHANISAIAANIETGIPAATQSAVRALRNKNSSATTRPSPIKPLSSRMSRRPVIASARVRIRSIETSGGSVASSAAATFSTEC